MGRKGRGIQQKSKLWKRVFMDRSGGNVNIAAVESDKFSFLVILTQMALGLGSQS